MDDFSSNLMRNQAEKAAVRLRMRQDHIRRVQAERRSEEISKNINIWKSVIIPKWDQWSKTDKVVHLAQRGIPPSLRGEVWQLMIGSDIQVSEEVYKSLYRKAVLRYEEVKRKESKMSTTPHTRNKNSCDSSELLADRICDTAKTNESNSVSSDTQKPVANSFDDIYPMDSINLQIRAIANRVSTELSDNPTENRVLFEENVENKVIIDADVGNTVIESQSVAGAEATEPHTNPRASLSNHDVLNSIIQDCFRSPSKDKTLRSWSGDSFTPRSSTKKAVSEADHRFDTVALIQWDLPRTFPTLGFFHDGGPMHEALSNILHAFSSYRPDVGYVQGMSFIVAMLLLYMSELEAFQAAVNLVARRGCLDFYRLKRDGIASYVQTFNHFFRQTLPMLFEHFQREGVSSEMYLMDWNLSLFCKALPIEVAARVWDCYLLQGEVFLVRTSLALLRIFAKQLCVASVETIMSVLVHFPEDISVDILLDNVQQIKISPSKYEAVRAKYNTSNTSLVGVTVASPSLRDKARSPVQGNIRSSWSRGSLSSPHSVRRGSEFTPPKPPSDDGCVIS